MSSVPSKFRWPIFYEDCRRVAQEFVDKTIDYLNSQPKLALVEVTMTDSDDNIQRDLTFTPAGAVIVRAQRTDTTALANNLDLDWEPNGKGIKINNLVGAAASTEYTLTVLVTAAT